jgi:hypothetical protein
MRKIAMLMFLLITTLTFGSNAQAGTSCSENYLGQVVCSGSSGTEIWTDTGIDWKSDSGRICHMNIYGKFVCN